MNKSKIILVTGASSRLGLVLVRVLLNSGHKVYRGQRSGGDVVLDLRSQKDCEKAIKFIVDNHKRLDVLINVAGVSESGSFLSSTVSGLQNLLEVNLLGMMRVNLVAAKQMEVQKFGRIINVTSLNGLVPLPGFGIYSASKSAAQSLGEVLHYELFSKNIKVTNVSPGAINFEDEFQKRIMHKTVREKVPFLKYLLTMTTPESISLEIKQLVESENNPIRVIMGKDAKITTALYRALPSFVFEKIVLFLWQKK